MIAYSQGKIPGKTSLFHGVFQSPEGYPLRRFSQREQGKKAAFRPFQGKARGLGDEGDGVLANQRPPAAPAVQKQQRLDVCQSMVQPWAIQSAVNEKIVIAQLQSPADGQHGIRVVLAHREHVCPLRHIAQRVKVP